MKREREVKTPKRRFSPALVISASLHVAVAVVLLRLIVVPEIHLFGKKSGSVPVERIGFLKLVKTPGEEPTPGRSGGNARPLTKKDATRLIAPTRVPATLPPITSARPTMTEEGTGPLVGTGGPARGIKPVFSDPRLWGPPGKIVTAPKTLKQDLDSLIAMGVGRYNDSLASEPGLSHWMQGDWTVGSGNHKIGIDPQYIRLGPVSIPTALLAMLSLNIGGNPTIYERNRSLNYMHRDISEHAQQAIDQADFNKAVRSIRERKERERTAAQQGLTGPDSGKN